MLKQSELKQIYLQNLKRQALLSVDFFSEKILGFENEKFHKEIYHLLESPKYPYLLILCPRSHGKTTCVSINYVLWNLVKNPNVRVILASNTITQSSGFLREITQRIEQDKKFRAVFGSLKPRISNLEKWSEHEIIIKRDKIQKDASVSCVGTGGTVLTKRADVIIADDILDPENTATVLQRKKTKEWFLRVLLPCLEPDSKLIVIGTRWCIPDLYGELLKDSTFKHKVYKAINGRTQKKALWESRWSLEKLMEKKRQMGSLLFNQQYQNQPVDPETALFKSRWIKYFKPDEISLSELDIYGSLDPAISQKQTADYSAFITIGIHKKDGRIFVLDCIRGHWTISQIIENIINKFAFYKHQKIGIETVAFQKLIKDEIDRISREKRVYLPTTELVADRDKYRRISTLQPFFENGTIFLKESQTDLVDELLSFPSGKNDDMVDALAYAIQLVRVKPEPSMHIFELKGEEKEKIEEEKPKKWKIGGSLGKRPLISWDELEEREEKGRFKLLSR